MKASGHDTADAIAALAEHMHEVISDQEICIDIVAVGDYNEGQQNTGDDGALSGSAGVTVKAVWRGWTEAPIP